MKNLEISNANQKRFAKIKSSVEERIEEKISDSKMVTILMGYYDTY